MFRIGTLVAFCVRAGALEEDRRVGFCLVGEHQMHGKNGGRDRRRRGEHPWCFRYDRNPSSVLKHHAPARRGFRKTEAEEGQRGFRKDKGRKQQKSLRNQVGVGGWKQVT